MGVLVVVSIFAVFLWRGMRAALRAPDRFGMLLGLGLVVGIVAQALVNISVAWRCCQRKAFRCRSFFGWSSLVPTLTAARIAIEYFAVREPDERSSVAAIGQSGCHEPGGRGEAKLFPAGLRLPASARQG